VVRLSQAGGGCTHQSEGTLRAEVPSRDFARSRERKKQRAAASS